MGIECPGVVVDGSRQREEPSATQVTSSVLILRSAILDRVRCRRYSCYPLFHLPGGDRSMRIHPSLGPANRSLRAPGAADPSLVHVKSCVRRTRLMLQVLRSICEVVGGRISTAAPPGTSTAFSMVQSPVISRSS